MNSQYADYDAKSVAAASYLRWLREADERRKEPKPTPQPHAKRKKAARATIWNSI
jgi:hypothetical protein